MTCRRRWLGRTLYLDRSTLGGFGEVAFIFKEGLVIEYMQYYDLSHWFGQPNPPGWQPEAW